MSIYPTGNSRRVKKMSVSLPPDLASFLESRAKERGTAVSSVLAEIVAKERAEDQQRRLDEALELDAEGNRAFARMASADVRDVFSESEW
jgi:Arc/MetJ-type ribon-helix-helix transcriptional regulator